MVTLEITPETTKLFKELILPTCTLMLAGCTFYVAYKQKKINEAQLENNRNQLKLNLYNRRYKIYTETKDLLLKICRDSRVSVEELKEFESLTRESFFLFEDDINVFLKQVSDKAIEKEVVDEKYKENMETHYIEHMSHIHWFVKEKQNLQMKFLRYLDLKNIAN